MKILKKEIVFTVLAGTKEAEQNARDIRSELYDKYDDVQIYHNGLNEYRIIAIDNSNLI